jgi:hypothetical protein
MELETSLKPWSDDWGYFFIQLATHGKVIISQCALPFVALILGIGISNTQVRK